MRPSERIVFPNMVLATQKAYRQNGSFFHFDEQRWQATIDIASSNFEENGSLVVAFVYKDLHDRLLTDQPIRNETVNKRYINSRIMAITMDHRPNKLAENVILKFKNLKVLTAEKHCMFWTGLSKRSEGFSEEGCHVVKSKSNSEETVYSCNHLTHFAVLMDYDAHQGGRNSPESYHLRGTEPFHRRDTFNITTLLLPHRCSSTSLSNSTECFYVPWSWTDHLPRGNKRNRKQSCLCYNSSSDAVFLDGRFLLDADRAIYLYLFVVKVYNINAKMHMYQVLSWGLPVIMVAISLGIAAGKEGLQSYTSDKYCWLSSTDNLTWIFVAFVTFIEIFNILILVSVIKEMTNLVQPTAEDNNFQQVRLGIKACVVINPLLGITWLFGLLLPVHKAFAYIFTILNSTQIKERFKRKMNIVFPSSIKDNATRKCSQVKQVRLC